MELCYEVHTTTRAGLYPGMCKLTNPLGAPGSSAQPELVSVPVVLVLQENAPLWLNGRQAISRALAEGRRRLDGKQRRLRQEPLKVLRVGSRLSTWTASSTCQQFQGTPCNPCNEPIDAHENKLVHLLAAATIPLPGCVFLSSGHTFLFIFHSIFAPNSRVLASAFPIAWRYKIAISSPSTTKMVKAGVAAVSAGPGIYSATYSGVRIPNPSIN